MSLADWREQEGSSNDKRGAVKTRNKCHVSASLCVHVIVRNSQGTTLQNTVPFVLSPPMYKKQARVGEKMDVVVPCV